MLEIEIVYGLIALGASALGGLGWLWAKRSKKSKTQKIQKSLGVSSSTPQEDKQWWRALEKSRGKFLSFSSTEETETLKENLEEACITSDLGVQNTDEALNALNWGEINTKQGQEREIEIKEKLSEVFSQWLSGGSCLKDWPEKPQGPTVIWFVGVNGVGKTTTIAKIARELKLKGHSVMLAAGDTFRAAAAEQLETWAERLEISCVRGAEGADPSSVLFDAIQSAQAKKVDYLLCDSAGRLHNQKQLMEALSKNKRVMNKALEGAPHQTVLVLDANTGQNMLSQAEQFLESVAVNGLILTKLDGSARGGAVVAIVRKTKLPLLRLGLGEKPEDLVPFNAQEFSRALLGLE